MDVVRASTAHLAPSHHPRKGDYLGTSFHVSWRWSEDVAARLRARGLAETVVTASNSTLGYQLADGPLLAGGLTLLALLDHAELKPRAWLRIAVPIGAASAAANALWHASGLAGSWWDGALSGRRLNEELAQRLGRDYPSCAAGRPRECLDAAFLAPLPAFQRTLLPHLGRLDAARAGGGAAVALHVRSGYADHVSSGAPSAAAAASAPLPQPFGASQRRAVHAAQWARLNAAYTPCGAQAAPPNATCLAWSEGALTAIATGGASCAAAASGVALHLSFHTETGESGDGALGSLLPCAAYAAASRAPGGAAAPWLLFAAGDLPPFFLLANRSEALAGHVATSEGLLGHVSFSRVCVVRPGAEAGQKACRATGVDPGGAWTRTMVDWFMLGACDVLLRLGGSSFPGAVGSRRGGGHPFWAQEGLSWAFEVVPKSESRAFNSLLHAIADEIGHQLEAEEEVG